MTALIDLSGRQFAHLTVIERTANRGRHLFWICRCRCGTVLTVAGRHLRYGLVTSCGCARSETAKRRVEVYAMPTTRTHGHATHDGRSGAYISWMNMIQRTTNPKVPCWSRYGGRGITVCDRWRHSFEDFLADMGERPAGLSIDRINNDGNYEPGNCRWATAYEQVHNRRSRVVA